MLRGHLRVNLVTVTGQLTFVQVAKQLYICTNLVQIYSSPTKRSLCYMPSNVQITSFL